MQSKSIAIMQCDKACVDDQHQHANLQMGRGMEVTPLTLTTTSVAEPFPVGRQLHQVSIEP